MGLTIITLAGGFSISTILNQWAQMDIFTYVLPFLLIFALVYGLLSKMSIFGDNKAVYAIIALALGLLSLVGDFVPRFFQVIAPNLAIGLSILLAAIILGGLFINEEKMAWIKTLIFVVGAIIFLAVVYFSLSNTGFVGSDWWLNYGPSVLVLLILIIIVAAIVWSKPSKDK